MYIEFIQCVRIHCLCIILETIFPPVFGKRLKAYVAKKGDRVIMEVEITGIPEPTVSWYKNDVPINEQLPKLRIIQQGNCYTLLIDKGIFLFVYSHHTV